MMNIYSIGAEMGDIYDVVLREEVPASSPEDAVNLVISLIEKSGHFSGIASSEVIASSPFRANDLSLTHGHILLTKEKREELRNIVDELVELASEENKQRAIKLFSEFCTLNDYLSNSRIFNCEKNL